MLRASLGAGQLCELTIAVYPRHFDSVYRLGLQSLPDALVRT
jgi:hypothetical protein